jgi:nicotinamide mononucleotide transporter
MFIDIHSLELLCSLSALVGLAALSHGRRWGWLLAAVSSLGYCVFNWLIALHGQALLSAVYLVTQVHGWAHWGATSRFQNRPRAFFWLLPAVPLTYFLRRYMQGLDAAITAFSLMAQLMTTAQIAQVWRVWLVIDLAAAVLYAQIGAWTTCGLYVIFAAVAESAHRQWRQHT